ncbi:hypothetical protein PtA15_5A550 [Puccinia triticina]|uniref:Uncharacterized protein n=1 Tax=Puccinia triticina TaxID=208348 RepID=A0ABY7CLV1_9BASI|nr:uncharacterized protein PtA15_5A550 [Puccinia triticina]WAQ84977.1 hypothetical protein PtA15_5A550 [Puccinia triticina]
MTDHESRAKKSTTSDPLSESDGLEERARLLHPSDDSYDEFYKFAKETNDDLAAKFLDMLEELFNTLNLSPDDYRRRLLIDFAVGKWPAPWEYIIATFHVGGNVEGRRAQRVFFHLTKENSLSSSSFDVTPISSMKSK